MSDLSWHILISLLVFFATFLFVAYGWRVIVDLVRRQKLWYQRVLVHQLFIDIEPRDAVILSFLCILITGLSGYLIVGGVHWFFIGAALGVFVPNVVVRHLEQKRRQRLDSQLIDGITTIASSVRAGLNLVQSMELLVKNAAGPIKQEFAQLLHEYNMGLDLNQCMRNASNRIGSSHYRLLFTAIEMHRLRGGDTGESLDRIAESIREIQRLEGKLDAVTAHGRTQARMMAAMTFVILFLLYLMDPTGVESLFVNPTGRLLLLVAAVLTGVGFYWIRRIMAVDI